MGKEEGKKLTKKPPQAPPKGGDVRGNGGDRRRLTTALRRRGCAWRDTCFLLRGKGFVAVWVVEGVKVVRRNAVFNS